MRPLQLPRRRLAAVLVAGATLALTAAFAPVLGEDGENDQPVDFTHNVNDAPARFERVEPAFAARGGG